MFKKKALTTAVQAAMVVSGVSLIQKCDLPKYSKTGCDKLKTKGKGKQEKDHD